MLAARLVVADTDAVTTDTGPSVWAIVLVIAVVITILRMLIALDKWNGTRFHAFSKSSRGSDIFGAMLTFAITMVIGYGFVLSLSQ